MLQKLESFSKTLAQVIDDAERNDVDFYFDTGDVTAAILGVCGLYNLKDRTFDLRRFNGDRTLVLSLAISGRIGPVRMLAPHEAEFLTLLDRDFGLPDDLDYKEIVEQVIRQVSPSLGRLETQPDRIHLTTKEAISAIDLFKIVHNIGGDWRARLAEWTTRKTLRLGEYDGEHEPAFRTNKVLAAKKKLDERREGRALNNFVDAAALVELADKAANARRREGRSPRFYLSSTLMADVAEAVDLDVNVGTNGTHRSAFCDDEYFKLRAAFFPHVDATQPTPLKAIAATPAVEIKPRDLLQRIQEVLRSLPDSRPMEDVGMSLPDLLRTLEDLRRFSFLDRVWRPKTAERELRTATKALQRTIRRVGSRSFEKEVHGVIRKAKHDLTRTAQAYASAKTYWGQFESISDRLRERRANASSLRVLRDLGLLRFGFEPEIEETIKDYVLKLASNDADQREEVVLRLVYSRLRAQQKTSEIDDKNLGALVGVLWAGFQFQEIAALSERLCTRTIPFKIILAASMLKVPNNHARSARVIGRIEEDVASLESEQRGKAEIGLGYVCFHAALARGFVAPWRDGTKPTRANVEWIKRSVDHAKQAIDCFRDNEHRRAFAVNQVLYYMVEGGRVEDKAEIDAFARRLTRFRRNADLWQYRFDDTLSRYFYWKSTLADDRAERNELAGMALRRANSASLGGGESDPEVQSNLLALEIEVSQGRLEVS